MIVSLLSLVKLDMPYVTNRKRSYYCERYKKEFYGFDESSRPFPTGTEQTCSVPSYDKTHDDEMTEATINFVRWAAGFNNTVTLDDTFFKQQCLSAAYMLNNWGTPRPNVTYKCYSPDLYAPYMTSIYSRNHINTANMLGTFLTSYYPSIYYEEYKPRGMLFQRNVTHFSSCGIGKNVVLKLLEFFEYEQTQDPQFIVWPHPGPIDLKLIPPYWLILIPQYDAPKMISIKANDKEVSLSPNITDGKGNKWSMRSYGEMGAGDAIFIAPDIKYEPNMKIDVVIETDGSRQYSFSYYTTDCGASISDSKFDNQFGRKSTGPMGSAEKRKRATTIGLSVFFVLLIIGGIVGFFLWWKLC